MPGRGVATRSAGSRLPPLPPEVVKPTSLTLTVLPAELSHAARPTPAQELDVKLRACGLHYLLPAPIRFNLQSFSFLQACLSRANGDIEARQQLLDIACYLHASFMYLLDTRGHVFVPPASISESESESQRKLSLIKSILGAESVEEHETLDLERERDALKVERDQLRARLSELERQAEIDASSVAFAADNNQSLRKRLEAAQRELEAVRRGQRAFASSPADAPIALDTTELGSQFDNTLSLA